MKNTIKNFVSKVCNFFTLTVLSRVKHSNVQLDHLIFRDDRSRSKLDKLAETNVAILKSSVENISALEGVENHLYKIYELDQKIANLQDQITASVSEKKQDSFRYDSNVEKIITAPIVNLEQKISKIEEQLAASILEYGRNSSIVEKLIATPFINLEGMVIKIEEQLIALEKQLNSPLIVQSSEFLSVDPETNLMVHMYSFLDSDVAIDVGAHKGRVSEQLSMVGYNVYAFEPNMEVFQELQEVANRKKNLHVFNFALGAQEKQGDLHLVDIEDPKWAGGEDNTTMFSSLVDRELPEHFKSNATSEVSIKPISNLIKTGDLPANIGILKIDTEGYDLEVIKGLGESRPSIVVAEYWDKENPWSNPGLIYSFNELVFEMKERDYNWHIDIQRFWGKETVSFSCNHNTSAESSWGNVFFFNSRELFNHAHEWCSIALPRTFYKAKLN